MDLQQPPPSPEEEEEQEEEEEEEEQGKPILSVWYRLESRLEWLAAG